MAVKVGSFTKSTNTSTPVSQAVTGVGFQPKALILWTAGAPTSAATWTDSHRMSFGITTGAPTSDYWPTGFWAEHWPVGYWV